MYSEVGGLGGIEVIGLDTFVLDGAYSHNTTQAPPSRNTPHVDVSGFEAKGTIK